MATITTTTSTFTQMKIAHRGRTVWAKLDVEDVELAERYTWHVSFDGVSAYPKTVLGMGRDERRVTLTMAQLLLGPADTALERVDHRNGNGLDCRRSNLRYATQDQILAKRRPSGGASRFKGVSWDRQREQWQATFRGQRLGRFDDELEAAQAFDHAVIEYWGIDGGYLNLPHAHAAPMTGARARLLAFALDQCLDTIELAGDPALLAARALAEPWVNDPPLWVPSGPRA